ncbi:MAG: hypothetical protein F6J93_08120 [Oscillatoria sp. SIO1A7]|nr:hypothetical protein [Oscillatoria sp. SIO1A7]
MAEPDKDAWLNQFAQVTYSKVGEEPADLKWLNPNPGEEDGQWREIVAEYYPKWNPVDAFSLVCWKLNPTLAKSLRLSKFMT